MARWAECQACNKIMKDVLIKFENISKKYITGEVEFEALKDIKIEIKKGDFVAIVGHSGSGKSTLMNIIGLLDDPTSGKYILNGKEIHSYNDDEKAAIRNKEIGFIFQNFNLLKKTSVYKNIERPMLYAKIDKDERDKRIKNVLKIVKLEDKNDNLSNQLSGGQIQRVAVARALVMNPSILLADEPTGNLPSKTSHEILQFFQELNKVGRTIILITHENEIAQYAKRIITLKDGNIISNKKNK